MMDNSDKLRIAFLQISPAEWTADAIDSDDDFVREFGRLAAELDMAIAVTLLEKHEGGPRNTVVLFDRHTCGGAVCEG